MLTLVEDTTPGIHDTLIAACDKERYEGLGVEGYHDNCSDNLHKALEGVGLGGYPFTPSPLNLFMNIPVKGDGTLSFEPPVTSKGQFVAFRAEMDLIVAFSACPQDVLKINDQMPTEAHFTVEG